MKISDAVTGYYNGNVDSLRGRKDPEAVKMAAQEMESLFAYEMIKTMRESVSSESKNNLGGDTYMSMFDMEIAKLFAERGLGLRDMLLKGINSLIEKSETAAKSETPKMDKETDR